MARYLTGSLLAQPASMGHRAARGIKHALAIALLVALSLHQSGIGHADASFKLLSQDGNSTIELRCTGGRALALSVSSRPRPPVFRPGEPTMGIADPGTVQYTFDGAAPVREAWLRHDEGVAPADKAQLQAFARQLFLGHVLHLGVGGMPPAEFQLDDVAERLRAFARTCTSR